MTMQQTVKGIGASPGIAVGKAFVLPSWEWEIPDKKVDVSELAGEFERLYQGIRRSKQEIEGIKREMIGVIGEHNSSIFDAHLAILEDPEFMREVQGIIQRQYKAAEVAVKEVIDQFASMFDLIEDEYMKERRSDIRDVGNRLLQHLLGAPEITLPADNRPFILVARELSPSQLAHLNPERVLGILTLTGGKNSHAAIMARSLGIPLVVSLEDNLVSPIQTGDELIIDGYEGNVYLHPLEHVRQTFLARRQAGIETRQRLREKLDVPPVTRDGCRIALHANINSVKELDGALENGVEGIGLFRTEFLFMDRSGFPGEEEQTAVYREVAERLAGRPVVIRTLDIGGDKMLDYHEFPEEDNPFLGYRAIRFSLDRKDIFKTQLRAILRAGAFGDVKIMFPMISSLEELRAALELLERAKRELKEEGAAFREDMPVGIMIEVPAAVMVAEWLAEHVDFFSIGTNDLIQYVLAVDRMNDHVAHLYDPFHPAVIKMIDIAVKAARKKGISVSVCGEMAGDPKALPLLIGLGVHDLSMPAPAVLEVKSRLLGLGAEECRELAGRLLMCRTGEEAAELLEAMQADNEMKRQANR